MWSGSCLSRSTPFLPGSHQRWVQPGFPECLEMGLQCWCTVAVMRANAGLHPRCWRCVNASRAPTPSPQVKLGSLSGSMEVPACFGAEIYAQVWQEPVLQCEVVARLGKMLHSSACFLLRSAAGCGRMVKASRCTCQVFRAASHLCCLPPLLCAGSWRCRGTHRPESQLWRADASGTFQAVGVRPAAAAAAAAASSNGCPKGGPTAATAVCRCHSSCAFSSSNTIRGRG